MLYEMITSLWKRLPYEVREFVFVARRWFSFLLNRHRINWHQINMGYFEKKADFSLMPSFAITFFFKECHYVVSKIHLYLRCLVYMILKRRAVVVFVNLLSVDRYRSQILFLRRFFRLSFVIDTYDKSLYETPDWINQDEKWFAPHIENVSSNSGILIPVGVEPLKWNLNGKLRNLEYTYTPLNGKILVGPFKITHPSRSDLLEFKNSETITVLKDRLSPNRYAELAQSFDFIFCPRGNGIDTHRLWETLYRGRIPILIESEHTKRFKNIGLPILLLKSSPDVYSLTLIELINIAQKLQFDPEEIMPLRPDYWWDMIKSTKED